MAAVRVSYCSAKSGNALLQVAVVGAAVGALGGMAAHLANKSSSLARRMREGTTVALLKNHAKEIGKDPGFWVTQLRKNDTLNSPTFTQCLSVIPAGPWTCPANVTVTDAVVVQEASGGRTVSSVHLYDMYGVQIAGTATQPLYYDGNGLEKAATQCPGGTTNPLCRFRAIGYMIRDNLSGTPGNVTFVRKVEQSPHTVVAGSVPLAPTYDIVRVGTAWRNAGGNGLPVGSILPFSGTVVPVGYLAANGTMASIATYPQLYAAIGTTWGPVVGGQFRLPDLRSLFLRGASTTAGGAAAVIAQQAGSAPLILAAGQTRATSDVVPHVHSPNNVVVSSLVALGSVVGTTTVSSLFGNNQWMGTGPGGGPANGGSDYHLPAGGSPVRATGSFVAQLGAAYSVTVPANTLIGTIPVGATGGAETRPVNVATTYIIRADY